MAGGCRDCPKCTRLGIVKLFMIIPYLVYAILFSWNYGLFVKKCPDCKHPLNKHNKRADGSFQD